MIDANKLRQIRQLDYYTTQVIVDLANCSNEREVGCQWSLQEAESDNEE